MLFSGAVGRKILVPFFLVRKVRRRLMGFQVPPPSFCRSTSRSSAWIPEEVGEKGLGAGATRAWHHMALECCG